MDWYKGGGSGSPTELPHPFSEQVNVVGVEYPIARTSRVHGEGGDGGSIKWGLSCLGVVVVAE